MKSQISGLFRTFQDQWEPCPLDQYFIFMEHCTVPLHLQSFLYLSGSSSPG